MFAWGGDRGCSRDNFQPHTRARTLGRAKPAMGITKLILGGSMRQTGNLSSCHLDDSTGDLDVLSIYLVLSRKKTRDSVEWDRI